MKKLLTYGFFRFSDFPDNPSKDLVEALSKMRLPGLSLRKSILSVSYRQVYSRVSNILKNDQYDIILGFGLSAQTNQIRLEKMAYNLCTSKMTDNDGRIMTNRSIIKGKRKSYRSQLNLIRIKKALLNENIPALISHDPGGFICNYSYFLCQHYISENKLPTKCLFVHIPFSSEIICRKKLDYPSFPMDMLVKTVRLITQNIL